MEHIFYISVHFPVTTPPAGAFGSMSMIFGILFGLAKHINFGEFCPSVKTSPMTSNEARKSVEGRIRQHGGCGLFQYICENVENNESIGLFANTSEPSLPHGSMLGRLKIMINILLEKRVP